MRRWGSVTSFAFVRYSTSYGPFSSTVRKTVGESNGEVDSSKESDAHLLSNHLLRSALAQLVHPSQLEGIPYQSPEWKNCMIRLYRTLSRLHNRPVIVSRQISFDHGPAVAVQQALSPSPSHEHQQLTKEDCLVRFLLSPEQRILGNQFAHSQFISHMNVDSVTALNFYASWYEYVVQLVSGVTQRNLTDAEKRLLSDDQKGKLEDLEQQLKSVRDQGENGQ